MIILFNSLQAKLNERFYLISHSNLHKNNELYKNIVKTVLCLKKTKTCIKVILVNFLIYKQVIPLTSFQIVFFLSKKRA